MKLDSSHIEYVLSSMQENTTYVRNIKKNLLAALYNVPFTISSYYTSLVNHALYRIYLREIRIVPELQDVVLVFFGIRSDFFDIRSLHFRFVPL